jgi:hypothetical protein
MLPKLYFLEDERGLLTIKGHESDRRLCRVPCGKPMAYRKTFFLKRLRLCRDSGRGGTASGTSYNCR